jgi:hypothetical protein
MPTKRRRHAITETPHVEAALDELRRELGTDDVPLGELVVLGARAKVDALRSVREEEAQLLRELAARVRAGDVPVDLEAADEVRRSGWAR